MLKVSICLAALAVALPAPAAERPKPVEHAVKLTDGDLATLNFLIQRTGERCAQDAAFCQAQLALNDMGRRLASQLKAESEAKPATPPAKP